MPTQHFNLSAFGDEIADDLAVQLDVLASEGIYNLELRSAWGRNVLDLDPAQLQQIDELLHERGFGVSAIATPIGKSDLTQPREFELARLERAIRAAHTLGSGLIRVFSFYVPAGEASEYRHEVLGRMAMLAQRAVEAGVTLVHENEKHIYGETPEHCLDILATVDSPALSMAFDPANFVQAGVRPMEEAWPLVANYTTHIHIKDAVFADGKECPAGEGDGAILQLLKALVARGYRGFLTLEPHLEAAGPLGGFSGETGMRTAIRALRGLLDALPNTHVV